MNLKHTFLFLMFITNSEALLAIEKPKSKNVQQIEDPMDRQPSCPELTVALLCIGAFTLYDEITYMWRHGVHLPIRSKVKKD